MLQRAAGNAYSWWWASHIRTKQSKWMEHNLQDMEEKVQYALKIIDDDGDTFVKRAEMYYRKRPEIVSFVEEAYRSYRALAERYDHLSRELQSANRTIATAFPEQAQFSFDDEDDDNRNKPTRNLSALPKGNIPKVPDNPMEDFKTPPKLYTRKESQARTTKFAPSPTSGLTKDEALKKIDELQKNILSLQTEKEFVKISYDRGYDKYWEIENEITEMQSTVCSLQDEFGVGIVIDDSEARTLMATTALKSVKDAVTNLGDKQKQSAEDAKLERERIKEARKKFVVLRNDFFSNQMESYKQNEAAENANLDVNQETETENDTVGEINDTDIDLNMNFDSVLTLTQLTDKIDELVNKVVNLEIGASSQSALAIRLRSEVDGLLANISSVEQDKETLVEDSRTMMNKIKELEEEISRVNTLNRTLEEENEDLKRQLAEANAKIDDLTSRLPTVNMEEDEENTGLFQESKSSSVSDADKIVETGVKLDDNQDTVQKQETRISETARRDLNFEKVENEDEYQPRWMELPSGLEEREKVLVEEYTSVLRSYRDVKRKLTEVEKNNRDGFFELTYQIRELNNIIVYKDVEIEDLRNKLHNENPEGARSSEYGYSGHENNQEVISQTQSSPAVSSVSSPKSEISTMMNDLSLSEYKDRTIKSSPGDGKSPHAGNSFKSKRILSPVEKRIRRTIDQLLEENLEFWLRFSSSFHHITKFETTTKDLKTELSKLASKMKPNGGSVSHAAFVSDARPIYRHLREIQTELTLWLENNAILKEELQGRFGTLGSIQDEITKVTTADSNGVENELSGYQAAKFHGEVLSLKQENTKISNKLQLGYDHVKLLKVDVEKTVAKLEDDIQRCVAKNKPQEETKTSTNRARIPLRSFLFGVKLKKQKHNRSLSSSSIFSCMAPAFDKQSSYVSRPGAPGPPQ